jgi:large subunit ribosomal protein L5
MTARLQEFYKEQVVPALMKQFGYKSVMEVPRITKITLNMGVGEAINDKKVIERRWRPDQDRRSEACGDEGQEGHRRLQDPQGYPIGAMVTLRGERMYEFLDRFVTVALPRVRDFRGVSGRRSMVVATTTSVSKSRSFSRNRVRQDRRCVV